MNVIAILAGFAALVLASVLSHGDPRWIYGTMLLIAVLWVGGSCWCKGSR